MDIRKQEVLDGKYVITIGYGSDLGIEYEDAETVAVTGVEDSVYRCSDRMHSQDMRSTLDAVDRYLEMHGHDSLDRPIDMEPVSHEQLQILADSLLEEHEESREPETASRENRGESARQARRKSKMLDHEKSPSDYL